jgi:hypothetical protein
MRSSAGAASISSPSTGRRQPELASTSTLIGGGGSTKPSTPPMFGLWQRRQARKLAEEPARTRDRDAAPPRRGLRCFRSTNQNPCRFSFLLQCVRVRRRVILLMIFPGLEWQQISAWIKFLSPCVQNYRLQTVRSEYRV